MKPFEREHSSGEESYHRIGNRAEGTVFAELVLASGSTLRGVVHGTLMVQGCFPDVAETGAYCVLPRCRSTLPLSAHLYRRRLRRRHGVAVAEARS